jgi:hypothetical protein
LAIRSFCSTSRSAHVEPVAITFAENDDAGRVTAAGEHCYGEVEVGRKPSAKQARRIWVAHRLCVLVEQWFVQEV